MLRFALLLGCVFAAAPSWADDIIYEQYDCVLLVNQRDSESVRLVFFRDGQVMATRYAHDEMVWSVSGHDYLLIWNDYGPTRVVSFRRLSTLVCESDPYGDEGGDWFGMARNMRNLRDAP